MVPEGWEATTLGDCVTFKSGGTPSKQKPEFWGGHVPWVSAKDLKSHRISDAIDRLTDAGAAAAKMADTDNILVLVRGMTLLKDVPVGLVTKPLAFNQDIKALVAKDDVNPLYLSYLLVGKKLAMMGLVNTANHGTGRLDTDLLKSLPLDLPPLPEQRRIADILSTWDKAIETTEALLATARSQKRALMQSLLTGKRRFTDFEGEEWKEVRLGDVLEEVRRPVEWSDDDLYRLISVRRRSGGLFHREDLYGRDIKTKNLKHARSGDFLISKMQVVHGAMGLVRDEFDGMQISGSYIAVVSKDPKALQIEFFDWLSRMPRMYHQTYLCSYGVHIEKMTFNFGLFLREKIIVPPTAREQARIVEVLSAAEQEERGLETQIANLRTEKKALMQQLLTGKRRVTV